MKRRLAAILAADVVGFSALVGADEEGTLRALKGHLSALEPVIGLNGGRVVKSTGDGFLAEFTSVVDAVACAETMQRQMAERNAAVPDSPRMDFRMGVHVGDIVADGDDILGDGVNIAARLEGIAPAGGVVVSGRVHEDVAGKLDLAFEDLGPQELKNISRPVPAFSIRIAEAAEPVAAPTRPDKPSVAVLAFDNLSSDPEQDYFADGITEDIITGLSRVPWIFVIARNSSFSYKGLTVDIRRIGRELGVRYVLEGSVRKAGQRLRVTSQLIDAESGVHIWADRIDGTLEDVFDLQDRITEAVVGAIAPEIRSAEIERAARKRPESLDAYDNFLRAQAAINQFRLRTAVEHLSAAIEMQPDYVQAKAFLAWLTTLVWHPDHDGSPENRARGQRLSDEVLATDGADLESQAYAGYVIAWGTEDFARGYRVIERACMDSPSCFSAWSSSCILNGARGDCETAVAHGETALRLNPRDPLAYRVHMGMAWGFLGIRDWDWMQRCVDRARPFATSVRGFQYYEITTSHWRGDHERARNLADKLMAQYPGITVSEIRRYVSLVVVMAPGFYDPIYQALTASGIPE